MSWCVAFILASHAGSSAAHDARHVVARNTAMTVGLRITPQFSGGALSYVPWHFISDRPLQLLVIRQPTPPERSDNSCETANPLCALALPDSVTDAGFA